MSGHAPGGGLARLADDSLAPLVKGGESGRLAAIAARPGRVAAGRDETSRSGAGRAPDECGVFVVAETLSRLMMGIRQT